MVYKPRILIVDDEPGICRTTAVILELKGYAVTTAKDGHEAIARVEEGPFDMILLDIRMPDMDGVETHRRIKRIQPETVAVMMTAYADEKLILQARDEGAYDVIPKPLDIPKLLAMLERVSERRRGALVLVVDDDPRICNIMKNTLTGNGCEVGVAHTGEQAIEMAGARDYDVLFIDVRLPTMNGVETQSALRGISPRAVPILMTGYRPQLEPLVDQALRDGAYACLEKPFGMEDVISLVDEIWEDRCAGPA